MTAWVRPIGSGSGRDGGDRRARAARGFTLIELLVVVAILSVLMSVLVSALKSVRRTTKTVVCASNMRTINVDFTFFAEGTIGDRGDSERLGASRFQINDFQEHLYKIDEFWNLESASVGMIPSDNPMRCPEVGGRLKKREGFACSSAAVGPPERVSMAMNMRLYRAEIEFKGQRLLAPAAATVVRADVLNRPYVPLVVDVDGAEAGARGLEPFYTAPPVKDSEGVYSSGRYWMPSFRHGGQANVVFVGGHVLRSASPLKERWDWAYQGSAEP